MLRAIDEARPDNLSGIVDLRGKGKLPAGAIDELVVEVVHFAAAIKKRMILAGGRRQE